MINPKKLATDPHNSRQPRHILPVAGKSFSLNCMQTHLANNVIVFGGTGSKKTRSNVRPNIEELFGNYVFLDPKGALYREYEKWYRDNGYKVLRFDFTQPAISDHYNPFSFLKNGDDIAAMTNMIVRSDKVDIVSSHEDPFWDNSNFLLFNFGIGYMMEDDDIPPEKKNFSTLTDILLDMNRDYNMGLFKNDAAFEESVFCQKLRKIDAKYGKGESWLHKQFRKLRSVPEKTMNTVFITAHAKMARLDSVELNEFTSTNDLDIRELAEGKMAVFVVTPDIDRSKDLITNIFFTQVMRALCEYADHYCEGGSLPRMVRFFLDDFGTSVTIDQFENMVSNIRARNISVLIACQSIGQLIKAYRDSSDTILANCDTKIYMGGNDYKTAEYFAQLCNMPAPKILNLPLDHNIIARRGEECSINETQDLTDYRRIYHPEKYEDVVWECEEVAG